MVAIIIFHKPHTFYDLLKHIVRKRKQAVYISCLKIYKYYAQHKCVKYSNLSVKFLCNLKFVSLLSTISMKLFSTTQLFLVFTYLYYSEIEQSAETIFSTLNWCNWKGTILRKVRRVVYIYIYYVNAIWMWVDKINEEYWELKY